MKHYPTRHDLKVRNRVIASVGALFAAYSLSCVPNSMKASKELEPLSRQFVELAKDGPRSELTDLVTKRNEYLAQNSCILANTLDPFSKGYEGWRVWELTKGKFTANAPTSAVCYNPFKGIRPYKGK